MKNKFMRSVTAMVVAVTMLISSQGVVTSFADGGDHSDMSESSSVQMNEVGNNGTDQSTEDGVAQCNCGATDGEAHKEGCPLYVKPDGGNTEDDAAQCTCGAKEGEPHQENCPLYVKPDDGNTNNGDTDNGAGEDADIKSVVDAINALPAVEDLNEETNYEDLKALVSSARTAYDALTAEQKESFDATVLEKLTALEAKISELESGEQETESSEAVQNVIEKIDAAVEQIDYTTETIPATDGTTVTKTHITMLKDLDPANNAELKALIDKEAAHEQDENQPALTDEEAAQLDAARKAFEDAKAKYLSEGFSNVQLAARQAYDALATEEEKAQVTNYSLLTDMEANIAYIMQAVNTLPAEVKQPEVNYPSETSIVDYSKRQSDSVTYDGYNYDDDTNTFTLHYTINENAGTNIIIEPSREVINAYTDKFGFNSLMPGVSRKFKIEINNKSSHTYHYKNNSFVIAPEDTSKFGSIEEGSLLPVLTYDGQLLPIQFTGAMIPYYFYKDVFGVNSSAKVTFEMMCQIYDYLAKKDYTGDTAITDYMLDYYNEKKNVNYESLTDLFADHPDWLDGNLVTNNGIWTMTEEELLEYIAKYPWINSFVSVKSSGNNLSVQIKWPEPEIAAVSYNSFYCGLFSAVYGKENAENLNPYGSGVEFSRAHGIGDYLSGTDLYQETNQYFSNLTANGFNTGDTLEIWSAYALDGPGMGNSYQIYSFSFYSIFELEDPSTSPEEPEDPTPTPTPTPDPDPTPRPGGGGDEDDDTPTIINETPVPTTTIEDEDVPLTDLPEDTVTIDDEEVPLKDIPNTGDMIPVPAMVAAVISIGGIALLMKKHK